MVYLDRHLLKPFRKIPLVRSLMRLLFFGTGNLLAIGCRHWLPNSQDLYLNNVLLATKPLAGIPTHSTDAD